MPRAETNGSLRSTNGRAFFTSEAPSRQGSRKQGSQVLACLDDDRSCLVVARHALAMADALGLPVTMAHVVEIVHAANAPADPLEWQLRLGECRERLDRIVEQERDAAKGVERVLLTGSAADELNGWARDHAGALLTLATHSQQPERRAGLGATVQKILDGGLASLLLVPNNAEEPGIDAYRKLLVPLDGSSRAESVLPFAARIAAAHRAELILAHILPKIEIVDTNSFQEASRDLRAKLASHGESHARSYLEGLRTQLRKEGIAARVVVQTQGDPREQLRRLALEHHVDLIVVSSHGHSCLCDVPCGSVTEYLATHAPAPLLIVRPSLLLNATEQRADISNQAASGQLAQ